MVLHQVGTRQGDQAAREIGQIIVEGYDYSGFVATRPGKETTVYNGANWMASPGLGTITNIYRWRQNNQPRSQGIIIRSSYRMYKVTYTIPVVL